MDVNESDKEFVEKEDVEDKFPIRFLEKFEIPNIKYDRNNYYQIVLLN